MTETKQYVRYSEAFKMQVVEQIEAGKFRSATQATRSYGIKGSRTVPRWVRRYGSEKAQPKQIKIMSMNEIDETKQLQKRVRELERALADAHMLRLLNESYLEIACERMGTDAEQFKKKHATLLSSARRTKEPR